MNILISGALHDPTGKAVSGAQITLTATANSPRVLRGFTCSTVSARDGHYAFELAPGSYAVSVAHQGRNFVYGAVTLADDAAPSSLNALLQQQVMEQEVTPEVILYFRQIQRKVSDDVVIMQHLQQDSGQAAHAAQESQRQAQASATDAAESMRQAAAHSLVAEQAAETAADHAHAAQDNQRQAQAAERAAAGSEQRTLAHRSAAEQAAENAAVRTVAAAADGLREERERTVSARVQAELAAESATQSSQQAGVWAQEAQAAADSSQHIELAVQQARDDTVRYAAEVQENTRQTVLSAQQAKEDTDTGLLVAQEIARQVEEVNVAVSRVAEEVTYVEQAVAQAVDKAPVDSPVFTGTPLAPTPGEAAIGQEIATAAFVLAQVSKLISASPAALDTLQELAAALGDDPAFSTTVMNLIGQKLDKQQNGADIPDKGLFLKNIGVGDATTSRQGMVQLNDSISSTSTTQAATANAVKRTYDEATRSASTSQAGRVQLNDSISSTSTTQAATANAVKRTYTEATRSASTSQAGRVQLNDSVSSTSTTQAATA
ncbi:tail fiber protein, partial [Edwardsiella piscicida]